MAKARIVAAVGTAAASGGERTPLSERVQAAMTKAVEDALAEGVSVENTKEMQKRILAARDAVLTGNDG